MTLDDWLRLYPRKGRVGVKLPEYQSVGTWGMFNYPSNVEAVEFKDLGKDLESGDYVSHFRHKENDFFTKIAANDVARSGNLAFLREKSDTEAIARHFGFSPDDIEILIGW